MLVILNSDILYTNAFVHNRLHQNWRAFAEGCLSINAELVFPRTALYEIELRQKELYEMEKSNIENASKLLQKYGIQFVAPIPEDLIKTPDLISLFRATGVSVRVENAVLEDFQDAERRAAMHLPPAPPRTQPTEKQNTDDSDEMRDLVIWSTACRLASTHGGAVLLSRDKVHTGKLGRREADENNLLIAKDFDEALGMLGAETEAGKIASGFLQQAWNQLCAKIQYLDKNFSVKTITNPIFIQGEIDLTSAKFSFTCNTDNDKIFAAKVEISDIQPNHFGMRITDISVNKKIVGNNNIEIQISRNGGGIDTGMEDRLRDLREIME